MSEKAILVVSFGTSFPETRRKTIDAIESYIQHAHPGYAFYHAWTSRIIRQKPTAGDSFSRRRNKNGCMDFHVFGTMKLRKIPLGFLPGFCGAD